LLSEARMAIRTNEPWEDRDDERDQDGMNGRRKKMGGRAQESYRQEP
jgi:hypothetical protein